MELQTPVQRLLIDASLTLTTTLNTRCLLRIILCIGPTTRSRCRRPADLAPPPLIYIDATAVMHFHGRLGSKQLPDTVVNLFGLCGSCAERKEKKRKEKKRKERKKRQSRGGVATERGDPALHGPRRGFGSTRGIIFRRHGLVIWLYYDEKPPPMHLRRPTHPARDAFEAVLRGHRGNLASCDATLLEEARLPRVEIKLSEAATRDKAA